MEVFTKNNHLEHYVLLKGNADDPTMFNGHALSVLKNDIYNMHNPTPSKDQQPSESVRDRRRRKSNYDCPSIDRGPDHLDHYQSDAEEPKHVSFPFTYTATPPAYTPDEGEASTGLSSTRTVTASKRKQADESRHARKKPKVNVTREQPAVTFQYGIDNKFEVPERIIDLREPNSGEGSESPQYAEPEHTEPKTKDELIDEEINALKPTYDFKEKQHIIEVLQKYKDCPELVDNSHLLNEVVKYCNTQWREGQDDPFPDESLRQLKWDVINRDRTGIPRALREYPPPTTERERVDAEIRSLKPVYIKEDRKKLLKTLRRPMYEEVCEQYHHGADLLRVKRFCQKPNGTFPEGSLRRIKDAALNRMPPDFGLDPETSDEYMPTPVDNESDEGSYSVNSDAAEKTDDDSDSVSTSDPVTSSNCITITRSNVRITPAEVATHVAPKKIKIEKTRWGAIKDRLEDMKSIPIGLWCPATSKNKPLGVTCINNQKHADLNNLESRLASEKPNTRLLQAYMQIKTPSGEIIKGRVQLDTQSNVNYVLAKHALPRAIRPWESTHCIGISNQIIKLGVPNQLPYVWVRCIVSR